MTQPASSASARAHPRLHDLGSRQNEPDLLALQGAWKLLYAQAVRTFYVQAVLTVLVPIIFGFALLVAPAIWTIPPALLSKLKAAAGLYALLIVLIDDRLLNERQQKLKRQAAIAQDMFDRTLFGLGWGRGMPGPLDGGMVRGLARKWALVDRNPEQMEDWYPVVVDGVPLHAARVIAQRSAIGWDRGLRERYAQALWWFAVAVFFLALAVCLFLDLSLADSLVAAATATPVLRWAMREERRQKATLEQLRAQYSDVRALHSRIVARAILEEEATMESRELQNAVFERRRSSPLGFPWLYRLLRGEHERGMQDDAEDCVEAYHRHDPGTKPERSRTGRG